MPTSPLTDYLAHGDALRARAARDRQPVAAIAEELGTDRAVAHKASWLSSTFDADARRRLGQPALARLTVTHLEAVAIMPEPARSALLRRAVQEDMSARALKRLTTREPAQPAGNGPAVTTGEDLASSARAFQHYLDFPAEHFHKLLAGPNGAVIRDLASAGRDLAQRIEQQRA